MIEKALSAFGKQLDSTIGKQLEKKIKFPVGLIVVVGVCSFILGILVGLLASGLSKSKKVAVETDDFDAEEYIRNLDLDSEEDE
ncbi:MAG: hypothetical protein J6I96_07760 [Oscillospiraceae bacterium]|nr:hypothetical protein [Oscillospiraceae bacterium]